MKWHPVNYGTARSDEGVTVARTGFKSMRYGHAGRYILIDVESGSRDLGIYAGSIARWEPSGDAVTMQERMVVVEHIKQALRVLKVPFAIVWN